MSRMTISGKPEEICEKTLGEYGAPSRHYLSSPIKFAEGPFIPLRPELIHKVDETAFQGKEGEYPRLHIATFVELCTALKPIDVDLNSMMLKLFRFSLKGKALEWFRNLVENGIKNWEECIATFFRKYIPQEELIEARNQMTSFVQMIGETFLQA